MKRFAANPQRRADYLRLRDFVRSQTKGARLSWEEVQRATGVDMRDQYGRSLFRMACRKEVRRYLTLPGLGVEFSSATNAVEICEREVGKVGKAIDRVVSVTGDVVAAHVEELPADEAKKLVRVASICSTLAMVRNSSKETKALPAKD